MSEKKMQIGVLGMLRDDGNDPFAAIGENGFKTAQLQCWKMDILTEQMAETVRGYMEKSSVRLAAYWAGYTGPIAWNSYDGPITCGLGPRDKRALRISDLKKGADFAKMIGAPAIITHCGFIPENPHDELYQETLDAIREVAEYCGERELGFWFETGQETPLTLLRTMEDLDLPNLGVNLDTANLILYGRGNPVDALSLLGRRVKNLHMKDGLLPENGHVLGKEVPLGEGIADIEKIIGMLHKLDFTGELIIEREISGPQQLSDILKARSYMEGLIAKYDKKS